MTTHDPAPLFAAVEPASTFAERFDAFDRAHPDVWDLFRRFAEELRAAGHERGSADEIVQRIRWHHHTTAHGRGAAFAINDHFTALYARKLAASDSRFREFFEFRARRRA